MLITTEPLRWGGALLLSAGYLAMCGRWLRTSRNARTRAGDSAGAGTFLYNLTTASNQATPGSAI